jgi:hypothetical protein
MKNRVDPNRIVCTIEENFKDELSKPKLRNLVLTSIAIGKTEKLGINEIARNLPVDVKRKKSRQTRLLRFLDSYLPLDGVTFSWTSLVLHNVYKRESHRMMILVDEVDLIDGYKALVAAVPFRKRAIPIVFKIFTNQQIRDMVYRSKNDVIWNFMDQAHETIQKVIWDTAMASDREPVFIFDRGFADVKLMKYLDFMGAKFIIRVRKNTGIVVEGHVGILSELGQWGYFRNVLYHMTERIQLNLFCAEDDSDPDDPVFIVSNIDDGIGLLYRLRMRIEEAFRDMKSLFGFRHLVLKDTDQPRVERILMLVIIGMGLLFLLFEKSGYRWSKYYNTPSSKEFSLIHVIADRIRVSWANLVTNPWFPLHNAVFY